MKNYTDLLDHALENIQNLSPHTTYGCDLHHELFNTDYWIIGRYKANKWLKKHGVFNVIDQIKEYEEFNFGEVTTDLSEPERVANMFAYIKGEEILSKSKTLNKFWNIKLDSDHIQDIYNEIVVLQ